MVAPCDCCNRPDASTISVIHFTDRAVHPVHFTLCDRCYDAAAELNLLTTYALSILAESTLLLPRDGQAKIRGALPYAEWKDTYAHLLQMRPAPGDVGL